MSADPPPHAGTARAPRRPTIRDVAEAAGVSVAVVSYAFNRPERVAAVTRERVLATAAAIGYAGPDPAARALRVGRHAVVALIGPDGAESVLAEPACGLVARGVAHACDRAGLAVLLTSRAAGGVDGAVVIRRDGDAGPAGRTVCVDPPADVAVPEIACRIDEGAAAAARHLALLGHRRLAVLSWPGAGRRLEGARRGWGRAGPLQVVEAPGPWRLDGEPSARAALALRPRPTAVLGLSDALAVEALDAAASLALAVPGDLSVVGVDDVPGSASLGLTTVSVPYRALGELAAGAVVAMAEGRPIPPAPALPADLVIRRTSGPAPSGR